MTDASGGPTRRPPERELLEAVAGELARRGFRTYLDPDGTDYFDLVVRRGAEVGIVEGKVSGAARVLEQALRRRAWASWVAVVLGGKVAADRLVARTSGRRAGIVGVWSYANGELRELRAPASLPEGPERFRQHRALLLRHLRELDGGGLPAGVPWSGVVGAVRRASGGRSFGEWSLDELDAGRP